MDDDPRASDPERSEPPRRASGAPELPDVLREEGRGSSPLPRTGPKKDYSTTVASLNVALNFVYTVVGLLLLGLLGDWLLGTSPTLTVVGVILGVIGGGIRFILQGMKLGGPPSKRG